MIGEEELSASDREYLASATGSSASSSPRARGTARWRRAWSLGWKVLRSLPRAELHRVSDAQIRAHLAG